MIHPPKQCCLNCVVRGSGARVKVVCYFLCISVFMRQFGLHMLWLSFNTHSYLEKQSEAAFFPLLLSAFLEKR